MKAVIMEKRGLSLVPIDEAGIDAIQTYADGKRLAVIAHAPPNEKFYRLWWALANKIVKSGAWDGDRESFKDWLLMRTGHMRSVIDPESGTAFLVAKSLSIDNFTEAEFRAWFDAAIRVVCEKLLARDDYEWLRDEIYDACERRNYWSGR